MYMNFQKVGAGNTARIVEFGQEKYNIVVDKYFFDAVFKVSCYAA